jgi:hypothetical protein
VIGLLKKEKDKVRMVRVANPELSNINDKMFSMKVEGGNYYIVLDNNLEVMQIQINP